MSLSTQWRRAGLTGVRIGLDYGAIPATAQLLGVDLTEDRFHDIRVMESAALDAWAGQR